MEMERKKLRYLYPLSLGIIRKRSSKSVIDRSTDDICTPRWVENIISIKTPKSVIYTKNHTSFTFVQAIREKRMKSENPNTFNKRLSKKKRRKKEIIVITTFNIFILYLQKLLTN